MTLQHIPIDTIVASTSPDLTSSANNPFPLLADIEVGEYVGPDVANRQPKALDFRTETLRITVNKLIDIVNSLGDEFLHIDGVARQEFGVTIPSAMAGNLDMGGYRVVNAGEGGSDADAVTKSQLDELTVLLTTLSAVIDSGAVLLDGSKAMTGNLDVGGKNVTGVANGVAATDAITRGQFDVESSALKALFLARDGSNAMTGPLDVGGQITSLLDPVEDDDAATRSFVIVELLTNLGVLVGTMLPWVADAAPAGWLICDGSLQSITAYPKLYDRVGTAFGPKVGDTFTLPDLRGRMPIGMDNMGTAEGAANRIKDSWADLLGGAGGTETVALEEKHTPLHQHGFDDFYGPTGEVGGGQFRGPKVADEVKRSRTNEATFNTRTAGGGMSHNNVQPSVAVYWIIKHD